MTRVHLFEASIKACEHPVHQPTNGAHWMPGRHAVSADT